MDSGNSGSMQSSSGGEDEYDSRADSVPAFFNHHPSTTSYGGTISTPHQPPSHHPPQDPSPSPSSFFIAPSNYLNLPNFPQSQTLPHTHLHPNSLSAINDVVWSRPLQSDPAAAPTYNTTTLPNLTAPPSSSSSQSILGGQDQAVQITNVAVKNPKKRTRASRRAPTTVLTTDTSNFRAMVQEFTGIPAPPFSASSSYSRRFDLFGSGSAAMRSGGSGGHNLDPLGSSSLYPLRPSAHKIVQPNPFLNSNSTHQTSTSNTIGGATTSNNPLSLDPNNYHHHLPSQNNNTINMQNPMLNFQSLLHPSAFPSSLKYPLADNFGANLGGFPGDDHVGSDTAVPLRSNNNNNNNVTASWMRSDGPGATTSEPAHHHHQLIRPSGNENYGVSGFKLNCSSGEKGLENIAPSRGEGTVDSWICPSD